MLKVEEFETKEMDIKVSKEESIFDCCECNSKYFGLSVIHTVHFAEGDVSDHICMDCYNQHKEDFGEESE